MRVCPSSRWRDSLPLLRSRRRVGRAHADRPVCDGETDGFVKVVSRRDGRIVGATIVASRAGEMIAELALAMQRKLTVADLAATIHAYPTWSTAVQQLAAEAAVDDFVASTSGKLAMALCRWTG